MGRKYAPATANLYLKKFDKVAMEDFRIHPLLCSRFLDDIFGVWPGTREVLAEYQIFLNSLIPGNKVTFTVCSHIIEFQDTQVYKHIDPKATALYKLKSTLNPPTPINYYTAIHSTPSPDPTPLPLEVSPLKPAKGSGKAL